MDDKIPRRPTTASSRRKHNDDESFTGSFGSDDGTNQKQGGIPVSYRGASKQAEAEDDSRDLQSLWNIYDNFKIAKDEGIPERLFPFLPGYSPAIGDLDPMLKIPMPEDTVKLPFKLGLSIVDEPDIQQSDPALVKLKLKSQEKIVPSYTGKKNNSAVAKLDMSKKESIKSLANWCQSVLNIQSRAANEKVVYQRKMPALDSLVESLEETFGGKSSQDATSPSVTKIRSLLEDLDNPQNNTSLEKLSTECCELIGIPVYSQKDSKTSKALIESLHVFFSLYLKLRPDTIKTEQMFSGV